MLPLPTRALLSFLKANLATVSNDFIPLILDPGTSSFEIVYLTAYTQGQTTGTIAGAAGDSSLDGCTYANGAAWVVLQPSSYVANVNHQWSSGPQHSIGYSLLRQRAAIDTTNYAALRYPGIRQRHGGGVLLPYSGQQYVWRLHPWTDGVVLHGYKGVAMVAGNEIEVAAALDLWLPIKVYLRESLRELSNCELAEAYDVAVALACQFEHFWGVAHLNPLLSAGVYSSLDCSTTTRRAHSPRLVPT